MTSAAGSKLGPYEIVDAIGAGGMGEVYRALDPRVGRDVAIKVSAEQFSDRFEREVRAVAALNHPNICTLYDVGSNYLVMELVEGPTLAERIAQGAIPLEESLEIARQIAAALEAAHEKGIVHRDMKPGNIKIKPDGTVKVLDFGLAKVGGIPTVTSEDSPTLSAAQTAAGVILGTAAYMSPEQARGKPVDKRADIWAFGVVLYEMLTGKRLFRGEAVSDTLASVLKEDPEWDRVPVKARRLLRSCLQKDPKQRLADISDAKLLLEDTPETAAIATRRPWLAWSITALCFLAVLALAFLYLRARSPVIAELMRFEIAPRVNLAWGSSFNISPDGRHLAFAASGSDGIAHLYIRDLNSIEARQLAGTESPHIPPFFWSPDSRFIAFDAGGKLKKIDINGGPAQTICDLSANAIGGSWNRDSVIIFGTNVEGLMRVAAAGGVASRLTQVPSQNMPAFLPDGKHFLYFQAADKMENQGVYVGSLDSKPEEKSSRKLLTARDAAAYVPSHDAGPGQILFLREQTLMAQRFDDNRLVLVGEPVPVIEQVGSFGNTGFFSASTNGILVYRSGGDEPYGRPMWFDRQGKALSAVGEASGIPHGLAISPDGGQVAICPDKSARISVDLWLHNSAQGTNRRLTFGQGQNVQPVWSPDGSMLIFASDRAGTFDLYQKAASGEKDEELLLKSGDPKFPTSWSSDGRFLLYSARNPKTNSDLWILPLEGDRKPISFLPTEFNESDGHFSPDMRWIAYASDESGRSEIYVRAFSKAAGASSESGGRWQISVEGGMGPRWGRDGKELYYRAPDGKVMAVEIKAGPVFQSGPPKALFQAPSNLETFHVIPLPNWDVSTDGNRFLLMTSAAEGTPAPFTVVLNWQAGLKK